MNGGELHSLLLLPLITEPDSNNALLQIELLGHLGDFLTRRPRLHAEIGLERFLLRLGDRRSLPLPLPLSISFPLLLLLFTLDRHAQTRTRTTGTTADAAATTTTTTTTRVSEDNCSRMMHMHVH